MNSSERIVIEADCARLMNKFVWCTDTFDYDEAITLFTSDCTFSRADEVFEGKDGVRKVLERRDPDRITRHILSNTVIDVLDNKAAVGKAYALVFGHRGRLRDGEEAPLGLPDSLVIFEGRFHGSNGEWRIAKWHIRLSFRRAAP